jgi:Cu/Ag efflux protein CusF
MKTILACLFLTAPFVFSGCSQSPGSEAAVQTNTYVGVGTVTGLDPKVSMIEIDHEDIKGLMPAMQMQFHLKDKSLLNGIKVGDRIEFTVERGVGGMLWKRNDR